jgi:hypothetical protein
MVEAGWFIADEHQRLAARSRPVGRDQVSHRVVADVGEAHGAQTGLDRGLDEDLEQRLLFQEFGLRARHLDQLDQQFLGALAGDAGVEESLDVGFLHGRFPPFQVLETSLRALLKEGTRARQDIRYISRR